MLQETDREVGTDDSTQQDPPDHNEAREVKEPDPEKWWENPGPGGEVQ